MVDSIKDHFLNPRNVGDVNEPSFTGRAGSFICGAAGRLSIQIDESHNICEAKFRAAGCEVLIASFSTLTEQVKGLSTADAAHLGHAPQNLVSQLNVDASHNHCVQLPCSALIAAIREFSDAARSDWEGDEALICTCFLVSEKTIERVIRKRRLTTVREVTEACNAGGGCGSCQPLIVEILESMP